ncbi:MAG TPA: hypothetical protein VHX42_00915 [Candidatus Babeliales bacterium]|jgi:hypothetical protein|nr:hypothetical protein [Candidatus Babeliales bacterium]
MAYFIEGKPAAADKYNGNIGLYLDCQLHLDQRQVRPFLEAIDYIKQQQRQ